MRSSRQGQRRWSAARTPAGVADARDLSAVPGASYSYNAAEEMSQSTVNGTTTPHVYAGGTQRELTSAGSNQFVWGHNDQYGQLWPQSFNTGGQSQVMWSATGSGPGIIGSFVGQGVAIYNAF